MVDDQSAFSQVRPAESGELTPTFKLRRRVVHAKCADVIDALYAD